MEIHLISKLFPSKCDLKYLLLKCGLYYYLGPNLFPKGHTPSFKKKIVLNMEKSTFYELIHAMERHTSDVLVIFRLGLNLDFLKLDLELCRYILPGILFSSSLCVLLYMQNNTCISSLPFSIKCFYKLCDVHSNAPNS